MNIQQWYVVADKPRYFSWGCRVCESAEFVFSTLSGKELALNLSNCLGTYLTRRGMEFYESAGRLSGVYFQNQYASLQKKRRKNFYLVNTMTATIDT